MRILVVHAWLRGNLGDVLQLSVLLSALRELQPRVLDLAGHPPHPPDETSEVIASIDRYLPDPFAWYWKFAPRPVRGMILEPRWAARRKQLFSRYDAIVCAPGPYLADYDVRAPSALADIRIARTLGRPVVLSSHSIGPLGNDGLAAVARATLRVAREPSTHVYLRERGLSSVQSADLAFLYPYARPAEGPPFERPYRLIFLRSNNLQGRALRVENGALFEGSRLIGGPWREGLVLATSDVRRDGRFLDRAARQLNVPWVAIRSTAQLAALVGGSCGVVSDRYHPAICAAVLHKPAQVLPNREPHKMEGLRDLLADHTLDELQGSARAGLNAVREALRVAA